ncbi:hypothetical protein CW304_25545 [Bacillus sp. UFRGS-B20]|nr:hypothetical protein CW304_25545 [Bacillus sp. UFRGS-B20]
MLIASRLLMESSSLFCTYSQNYILICFWHIHRKVPRANCFLNEKILLEECSCPIIQKEVSSSIFCLYFELE